MLIMFCNDISRTTEYYLLQLYLGVQQVTNPLNYTGSLISVPCTTDSTQAYKHFINIMLEAL